MKTRLYNCAFLLGFASSLAMVGTTLAAPVPQCPDGMKVKGEIATDGSFSCIPIAASEPRGSSTAPAPTDDAKKLTLETIMAFNTDHDIGKAKAGYQNVLKLYPNYVPARYGLGLMMEAKEDWEGARQTFQQVATNAKSEMFAEAAKERLGHIAGITESEKTPAARQHRQYDDMITQARALLDARQLSEAAKQAIEAHDLDDSRWEAYLIAGEAAQALGLVPQAIHFYEAAEKRAPSPYKEKISRVAREESKAAEKAAEEAKEAELWKKAESGNDKRAVEAYINRYPAGRYLEAANAKLQAIKELEKDVPVMIAIPGRNYEMGKYEVTQAEWEAVMGSNPSHFKGANLPVEQVSWNDVQEYLTKLNQKTGRQYRLPTEAEWEYACYGGSRTDYCGSNDIDAVAWYEGNSGGGLFSSGYTHPVGQLQANGYGLYDMSGNIWEWTSDCWEGNCTNRVLRGGSWYFIPFYVRAAYRLRHDTSFRDYFFGFRLARTLP